MQNHAKHEHRSETRNEKGRALAGSVTSNDYAVVKSSRCTGLQQCTGRAQRATPSVDRPKSPPLAGGAARDFKKCSFPLSFSITIGARKLRRWAGVVAVIEERKLHAECGDDLTIFMPSLIFVQQIRTVL